MFFYWNIGKTIKEDIIKVERAGYGEKIVADLAKEISEQYGRGYSRSNLFRMVQLYESFSKDEIVATLSQQLTWSHIKEIISIKDALKREFYEAFVDFIIVTTVSALLTWSHFVELISMSQITT